MLEYLKILLNDLKFYENNFTLNTEQRKQIIFSLETAIEILEKLKKGEK